MRARGRRRFDGAHTAAVTALVVLGLVQLASAAAAPDRLDGYDNVLRFAYFVSIFIALPIIASPRTARTAALALVVATVVRLGYEAIPYFLGGNFVLHPSYQFGRWTSNPNTMAGLAAPVLSVALALAVAARRRAARAAYLLLAMMISAAIVLSFSKSAWLAAATGICVLTVLFWKTLMRPAVVGVSALTALALLALPPVRSVPAMMLERWTSAASTISNDERLRYATVAVDLIERHPLLGVGLEQFPSAYRASTAGTAAPDDPHNAYLHVGAELGIPAMTAFVVFNLALMAGAWKAAVSQPEHWTPGILAAVCALVVFQLFSSEPWTSRVFWVIAALPWAAAPDGTGDT
jgi:O-antigen ligase